MRIKSVVLTVLVLLAVFTAGAWAQMSGISNNVVNGNYIGRVTTNIKVGASFSGVRGAITGITVNLSKIGTPSGEVVVEMRSDSYNGTILASATVGGGQIPSGSYSDFSVSFPRVELVSAANTYYVVFSKTGSADDSNYFVVGCGNNGSVFGEVTSASWAWLNSDGWVGHSILGAPKISFNVLPAGTPPASVQLSAVSISFDSVNIGQNVQRVLRVRNIGGSLLTVTGVSSNAGEFTFTPAVPPNVNVSAGDSMSVTVKFAPASAGNKTGTLTINHNAPGLTNTVALTGTGVVTGGSGGDTTATGGTGGSPGVSLTPYPVSFDSVVVGSSGGKLLRITNIGTASLTVSSITVGGSDPGMFAVSTASFNLIPPGEYRETNIIFAPTSLGAKSCVVYINHNAAGGTTSVSVSGVGKQAPPVAAPTVNLAAYPKSGQPPLKVLLTNAGNTAPTTRTEWQIRRIGAGGPDIQIFQSRRDTLVVTLADTGRYTVFMVVDGPGGGDARELADTIYVSRGIPKINLSTDTLGFDRIAAGGGSRTSSFTVSNTGTAALEISRFQIVGADSSDFLVTTDPATIGPGGSKGVQTVFQPVATGQKSAQLRIYHNAAGSPSVVNLGGTAEKSGVGPAISITPLPVEMGIVEAGDTARVNLVVTSSGSDTLRLQSVTMSGLDASSFRVSGLSSSLAIPPRGKDTLEVSFFPKIQGAKWAIAYLNHNASGSPSVIYISGECKGTSVVVPPVIPGAPVVKLSASDIGGPPPLSVRIVNRDTSRAVISRSVWQVINVTSGRSDMVKEITYFGRIDTLENVFQTEGSYLIRLSVESPTGNASATLADTIVVSKGSPVLKLSTTTLGFDPVKAGSSDQSSFTILNTGTAALEVASLRISGGDSTNFAVKDTSFIVGQSSARDVLVTFKPLFEGNKISMLRIGYVGVNGIVTTTVYLGGTAETPAFRLGDFNHDGIVSTDDFYMFADYFGEPVTSSNQVYDLNMDRRINLADFFIISDLMRK